MRLSGQPFASAASISGSSLRCSRPRRRPRRGNSAASAGRYCVALDLAADPVALELRQDLVQRRRREIHLVERLHGGKPRRAAAVGAASLVRWCRFGHGVYFLARWRLSAISASAARAASPPLSCSVMPRARPGLRLGVDGEDAVAERQPALDREVDQRARRLHRHDVEMEGLALDHAAERDRAVIGLLLLLGRVDRDGDGRHDLERARHGDDVPGGLGLVERLGGAGQQRVGDVVVEPRLDHEDARARGLRLLCWSVCCFGAAMIPLCEAA